MSRVFGGCRVLMAAATAKSGAKKAAASSAAGAAAEAVAVEKPKNAGIMKAQPVSPAMKKFVGAPEISRAEAIKKIWEHIKGNQLQNPANKREIHCDETLKTIFDGREKVGMFEIARLIVPHFKK